MHIRTCRAPGCGARTSRYGQFCSTHRSRSRRHGHPEQRAITKADLTPYVKRVSLRIAKNEDSPVWSECTTRWHTVVDHARGILAHAQQGKAGYRHERIAAHEVVKLADHVDATEVVKLAISAFLLEDNQPRRFRSDRAFRFQLVRRLRGLTDVNAGSWLNHRTGKTHRAYRDLTPRAVLTFAGWIIEALGGVALYLAKLERQEVEAQQQRSNALVQGLEALC